MGFNFGKIVNKLYFQCNLNKNIKWCHNVTNRQTRFTIITKLLIGHQQSFSKQRTYKYEISIQKFTIKVEYEHCCVHLVVVSQLKTVSLNCTRGMCAFIIGL